MNALCISRNQCTFLQCEDSLSLQKADKTFRVFFFVLVYVANITRNIDLVSLKRGLQTANDILLVHCSERNNLSIKPRHRPSLNRSNYILNKQKTLKRSPELEAELRKSFTNLLLPTANLCSFVGIPSCVELYAVF